MPRWRRVFTKGGTTWRWKRGVKSLKKNVKGPLWAARKMSLPSLQGSGGSGDVDGGKKFKGRAYGSVESWTRGSKNAPEVRGGGGVKTKRKKVWG